ncbi:MAG: hypothetical protein PHT19_11440 [Methylococcus sp.]|nr:hypothetical protein [Methylococcus sp.]
MKKILVQTGGRRDSTSLYRCMGPLSHLAKTYREKIQIDLPAENEAIAWERLADVDMIYLHRPTQPSGLMCMKMARLLNIPVWADYDDWLFDVPEWNPAASRFKDQALRHVIATVLAGADLVTVSTEALRERILPVNSNTHCVPNAYRSDIFQYREEKSKISRKDIYFWRGSQCHDGDLLSVAPAFRSLSRPVHFWGAPSQELLKQMQPQAFVLMPGMDPLRYFMEIYRVAPKVFLVPLEGCFFNRCKSNIAWQEAIHAGALCVAPDMPEWHHPGIVNYDPNNSESFLEAAERAMALSHAEHSDLVSEAYEYMLSRFDIAGASSQRLALVNDVLGSSEKRNRVDMFDDAIGEKALERLLA